MVDVEAVLDDDDHTAVRDELAGTESAPSEAGPTAIFWLLVSANLVGEAVVVASITWVLPGPPIEGPTSWWRFLGGAFLLIDLRAGLLSSEALAAIRATVVAGRADPDGPQGNRCAVRPPIATQHA